MPEVDLNGVDLSQVRRMLALTPAERLRVLESALASMMKVRDAAQRAQVSRNSAAPADAGVEAIVVGMAAAVIQGAPTMTWDLDVVHRRTPDNVQRLLGVLNDIDAVARGDARRLKPNASHLLGPGHILLETRFGTLTAWEPSTATVPTRNCSRHP